MKWRLSLKPEYRKENSNITSFLAALQFLTSIPVSLKRELSSKQLGYAIACFPLVGLLIGGMLAGLNWVFSLFLPASVANILLVISLIIITGAIHLDGLSDTCDGIAGHKTVEERWKVMRDSRTGAFGVVGVVLILLAQYVCLNAVPADRMTAALLFMPVVSRWAMVYGIFAFPYARPTGLGKAFKAATRWPQFVIAGVITLAIAGGFSPLFNVTGFLLFGGAFVVTTVFAFYLKYKFAGLTGDTYGAINEASEVAALLCVIIIFKAAPGLLG
jgi:adenosylcobinamide-GDP ribazoletransferase